MTQRQKITLKNIVFTFVVSIVIVLVAGPFIFMAETEPGDIEYGATYSAIYAEKLGIDPMDGFRAVVEELGVSAIRVPVYWDRVEVERDVFDWSEIDAMMSIARDHDVKIVLAIGRRVPRWPECFTPEWTLGMTEPEINVEVFGLMSEVVGRYKDDPALGLWQVENEPLLNGFGECALVDRDFLQSEFTLVRSLDTDTKIMTTASGEQSLWVREAELARDVVGVSVYKTVHNPVIGYIKYYIPAWIYRARGQALGSTNTLVAELQTEPWFVREISSYTLAEQLNLFDARDLESNIAYAQKIGFAEVYVWGVEWWYFMKINGHPDIWETGKRLME